MKTEIALENEELKEVILELRTQGYSYKEIRERLEKDYEITLAYSTIGEIYKKGIADVATLMGVSSKLNTELIGSLYRAADYAERASRLLWERVEDIKSDPEVKAKDLTLLLKEVREQQKQNIIVKEKMADKDYKDTMKLVEVTRKVLETIKLMNEQGIIEIKDKNVEDKLANMFASTR